jgi:hypothetical protein
MQVSLFQNRLARRLAGLTPEQRADWSIALSRCGYKPLSNGDRRQLNRIKMAEALESATSGKISDYHSNNNEEPE